MEELLEFTRSDLKVCFEKWYERSDRENIDEKEAYENADYMIELLKEL